VRRAERSGGQRSEGDARRYYGEHKNSRAMTFEHYYIDIPIPRLFLGARHYGRGCLDVAVLIWWAFIKGGRRAWARWRTRD